MNISWLVFAGLLALGTSAPVGPYNRSYGGNPTYRGQQGATSTSQTYGYQSSTTSHSNSNSYGPQGVRHYGGSSVPAGRYAAPVAPSRGHYGAPAAPARGHYGGPAAPAAPFRPAHPSGPSRPSGPQQPSRPHGPAYRAPAAPAHYGAASSYRPAAPAPSYGPVNNRYSGPAHGSSAHSHDQNSVSHGREMKYTINDPYKGTTHITETHIVSNKEMHGAEAEAAMKKLMGTMGPSSYGGTSGGFHDIASGIGLPFY